MLKRTKKYYILVAVLIVGVIGFILVKPVVNRILDDIEVGQVNSAYDKLFNEIKLYKASNPQKTITLAEVQDLLKEKTSLQNLRNPQTHQPYSVKMVSSGFFITNPSGQKFLNYERLDGTSFYLGRGTCDDPSASRSSFIAYEILMKRTSGAVGRCKEI